MINNFHEAQRKIYLNLFSFVQGKEQQVQLSNLFFDCYPPLTITMLKTNELSKSQFSLLFSIFNKCLPSGYYVQGTALTPEDTKVNK